MPKLFSCYVQLFNTALFGIVLVINQSNTPTSHHSYPHDHGKRSVKCIWFIRGVLATKETRSVSTAFYHLTCFLFFWQKTPDAYVSGQISFPSFSVGETSGSSVLSQLLPPTKFKLKRSFETIWFNYHKSRLICCFAPPPPITRKRGLISRQTGRQTRSVAWYLSW